MPKITQRELDRRALFGETLRGYRQSQGHSQEQLGHLAGLDRTYVGAVERGERNVSLDNIYRLADALNLSPVELFRG